MKASEIRKMTPEQLNEKLADAEVDTIYLGTGTFSIGSAISRNLTIIGNGETTLGNVKVAAGDYDVTISNVDFTVNTAVDGGQYAMNLPHNYTGDVTIDNCTITARYGIYADKAGKVTITNCVFDVTVCPFGWTNADEVVFKDNVVKGNPTRPYLENYDAGTDVDSDYALKNNA